MATQDLLDPVRFYTALDPYYYTVDNRPLQDIHDNLLKVSEAVDASMDSSKSAIIAAGFAMRGYAKENYAVGQVSYNNDLTFNVDRAILNQSLPVDGTDTREVPHLGIQVDTEVIGPFNITAGAGQESTYLVQARRIASNSNTPFFDPANASSNDAFILGNIEFQIKQGPDVSTGSGLGAIPSADAGWIPLFKVVLENGELEVDTTDVFYGDTDSRFYDEGAAFGSGGGGVQFELNVDTRIASAGQQTFNALLIDATYALVFVDGTYQSGATVVNATTIELPGPVPEGTVVDFVTTAGGTYQGGRVKRERRVATAGQTTFDNLPLSAPYASVYVSGLYQDDFTVVDSDTITLPEPMEAGTVVVFEEKTAGVADISIVVPSGGTTGQVLAKASNADYDYVWSNSSGSGVPIGGDAGQVLTKNSSVDGDADWQDPQGGSGSNVPFSVETQVPSTTQSVFIVSTDPETMMVFQDGEHITEDVTAIQPNQIVLPSAVPAGTEMVFVQTGGGNNDDVTIQKENDLQLILNSTSCKVPPLASIDEIEAIGTDGIFVAGSTTSGEIWRSTSGGEIWESSTPPNLPSGIQGIAYSGSIVVAVGDGNVPSFSTDDGISWTFGNAISGTSLLTSVTYDPDNAVFIAVGEGGVIASSSDGQTWTDQIVDSGGVSFLDVHNDNGITVAVGSGGTTSDVYTSTDGSTWSAATISGSTGEIRKVFYGGSRWILAGEFEILTSVDGVTYGDVQNIEGGRSAFYIDGVYLVFADNGIVWASTDTASTWIRYRMMGESPTDVFKAAAVSGTDIVFLGSYQMARHISKIRRGY